MHKMILSIVCFIGMSLPLFGRADESGYIGEKLGIDFYSRIDENTESTIEGLRQNRLREYGTFRGFGRDCRPAAAWLDDERIDEQILIDASRGAFGKLGDIARRKGVPINSDSMTNLVSCFAETYRGMYRDSSIQENALMNIGSIGLYSDGDTKNSDYDIVSDIEKINTILFAKRIDYTGTKNIGKISLENLLAGKGSNSLFETNIQTPTQSGNTTNTTASGNTSSSGSSGTGGLSTTVLTSGSICRQDGSITDTAVGTIVDEDFLRELEDTLRGYGTNGTNGGTSYEPSGNQNAGNTTRAGGGGKEKDDFFNTPRCDGIFCIKVKTQTATQNLLGGGKTYSIESLLEKHTKIAEPISLSDLSQQKMTNNSFQLPFLNIKFRDKVSGGRTYLSSTPQPKDRYKKEETEEDKNTQYEVLRRCAYEKAGLSADKKEANSILGAGFALRRTTTTETAENTVRNLGPTTVSSLGSQCYSEAIDEGRSLYYQTFSTDLSDIEAFTLALINEIDTLLQSEKKLDTLPIK